MGWAAVGIINVVIQREKTFEILEMQELIQLFRTHRIRKEGYEISYRRSVPRVPSRGSHSCNRSSSKKVLMAPTDEPDIDAAPAGPPAS